MSAWLIDTLLYTGLLIALVLVLRRPVGKFFGPQLAYGLWALPFLRLLLPPIVLPASLAPEPAPAMPAAEWVPMAMDAPVETTAAPIVFDPAPPQWMCRSRRWPPRLPSLPPRFRQPGNGPT